MRSIRHLAAAITLAVSGLAAGQPTHQRGAMADWDALPSAAGVPSLKQLLDYEIGEHFIRHPELLDTIRAIAAASDRVVVQQYGRSHQRRPLVTATVSSADNIDRLDEIFEANRRLADPATPEREARRIIETNPTIVWLSFGVHGNEASTAEAALLTLHRLATATADEAERVLEIAVVVIDPALNPDGRQRYVAWYENQYGVGAGPNPDRQAAEHDEPWPGGRTNHYLFDLNRDWIWLVHPESASRMRAYRRVLPHVHIDNHEQGFLSPYFFGAGDEPYNTNIPQDTRAWIDYFGDVYSEVFDRDGRLYATRERFDYLYPGYGKVLPVYHGAIGMLTEQAGHGRAGLAIEIDDRYDLTLAERAENHYLVNMATVEAAADNRAAMNERFRRYFTDSVELGQSQPFAVLVPPTNDPALLQRLHDFCEGHGIEIRRTDRVGASTTLYAFDSGEPVGPADLPATRGQSWWLITAEQPMGRLVRVAFERDPEVTDPDTYDVTSWSLPVAFGLEAYYTDERITGGRTVDNWSAPAGRMTGAQTPDPVAWIIDADQHRFPAAVHAAADHDIAARYAGEPIEVDGVRFERGSLIVHERRNRHGGIAEFAARALEAGLVIHATENGITTEGPVLGANANPDLDLPRVGLIGGSPTSSNSFGAHWHTLDLDQPLPYSVLNAEDLSRFDLDEYNVLCMPSSGSLDSNDAQAVEDYVRGGGVLVASSAAAHWAQRTIVGIDGDDENADKAEHDDRPPRSELTRDQRRQRSVEDRVPGSLFKVTLDTSHLLASGLDEWVGVIKRDARVLRARDNDEVIGRYAEDHTLIGGLASERNLERIAGEPFMTVHRVGGGYVICIADDTTFRGFTHASKRLLLNALMYGPSL